MSGDRRTVLVTVGTDHHRFDRLIGWIDAWADDHRDVEDLAPVRDAFDELVFSWHLGATKPDPVALAAAGERLGVAPGDLLLVDDSDANVDAASEAGWRTHRYTTALGLRSALRDAGLL